MADIFMTFIGTGKYEPVNYTLNGDCENNRFVSKALLQMLTRQGKQFDKLYFFLTKDAEKFNWESYYRSYAPNVKDEGLHSFLEAHFPGKYEPVPIPDGSNEMEIAELFRKIYDKLGEGDTVTVDTTHGFRSLPLLFSPILQYAKELKKITVEHMYYGLYTDKDHDAPIFDMRMYDRILDCANAAHNFIKSGNASEIREVFMNYYKSLPLEEKKLQGESKYYVRQMEELTHSLLTCQGGETEYSILPQINKVNSKLHAAQASELHPDSAAAASSLISFMDELLKHALGSFRDFETCETKLDQFFQIIQWYLDHDLLPQGYTALRETIITMLCLLYAPEFSEGDGYLEEALRETLKHAFEECVPRAEKPSLQKSMSLLALHRNEPNIIQYRLPLVKLVNHMEYDNRHNGKNLQDFMNHMSISRNCIDHFGMNRKNARDIKKTDLQADYDAAIKLYQDLKSRRADILTDEEAQAKLDEFLAKKAASGLFVNFSNHPSANWSEEQRSAALAFDCVQSIADVPFPQVKADATETKIETLAEEYVKKLIAMNPAAVMCMGETGVCFEVVRRLKAAGIRVVYTCTERQATENLTADGTEKTSVFRFVKFREY